MVSPLLAHHRPMVPSAASRLPGTARLTAFDILFLAAILWPYYSMPATVTAVFMISVATFGILFGLGKGRQKLGLFWLFAAIVILRAVASIEPGTNWDVYFKQSNHLFQFLILYPGFVLIVSNANWVELLLRKSVFLLVTFVVAITSLQAVLTSDDSTLHNINLNWMAMVLTFFFQRRRFSMANVFWFSLMVLLAALVFDRTTNLALMAFALVIFVWDMPGWVCRVICILAVFLPIFLYLIAPSHLLLEVREIDPNTWIRAEFLRGAFPYLTSNPIFGTGFDTPYRDWTFRYTADHPLLREPFRTELVGNHHSVFDTALRLGIPAALLLAYLAFIRPDLGQGYTYRKVAMAALALGLGNNAGFENQKELAMVALLIALLTHGKRVARKSGRLRYRRSYALPSTGSGNPTQSQMHGR